MRGDVIPPSLGNRLVGGHWWLGIDFVTVDSFVNHRAAVLLVSFVALGLISEIFILQHAWVEEEEGEYKI